jgi:chorismate synthase
VRWTVDPLRAANAALNIRGLGATARAYFPDYYGVMKGIDAGAPTDRLLVEWLLNSPRARSRRAGPPPDLGYPQALPVEDGLQAGLPALLRLPEDFVSLSQSDPGAALEWRMRTREQFLRCFARGYILTGFTRVGGPAYLLERVGEAATC